MPYTKLGDIHRIVFEEGYTTENLTIILTMDNFIVFHGNVTVASGAGSVVAVLPEYFRPAENVYFKVVWITSDNTRIGDTQMVLTPGGELKVLDIPSFDGLVLCLNGVVVSVSDRYYYFTKEQGFENSAPTTAIALMEAFEEQY